MGVGSSKSVNDVVAAVVVVVLWSLSSSLPVDVIDRCRLKLRFEEKT